MGNGSLLSLLGLMVLSAGCEYFGSSTCVEGTSVQCACADGNAGAQVCTAESKFAECVCQSQAGASADDGTLSGPAMERAKVWLAESFNCRAVSSARLHPCGFTQAGDRYALTFSGGGRCEDVYFSEAGDPEQLVGCVDENLGVEIPSPIVLSREVLGDGTVVWSGGRSGWVTSSGEAYPDAGFALMAPPSLGGTRVASAAPHMKTRQARGAGNRGASAQLEPEELEELVSRLAVHLNESSGDVMAKVLAGAALKGKAADMLAQASHTAIAPNIAIAPRPLSPPLVAVSGPRASLRIHWLHEVAGTGQLDERLVIGELKKRLPTLLACFEEQLRRQPNLRGTMRARFKVESDRNVDNTAILANSSGDHGAGACVTQTLTRFRFSPGPEGGNVTYLLSLDFTPSGQG